MSLYSNSVCHFTSLQSAVSVVTVLTNKMSLITRKPFSGVCNQVRIKPACSAPKTSYRIENLALASIHIISSPEPSGSQGELIVYPCSGFRCCRQQCLNISSETAWPIKAKLYVEPPWEGGTKVYINGSGHMTKMAAMPIYGKNL